MTTKCYAQVRGSSLRVTGLSRKGRLDSAGAPYAVSRSVAKVTINEVTESGGNELLRTPDDEPRIHFVKPDQTIRYTVDIDFLRVDPGMLSLVTGMPLAHNALGEVVGFNADTRLPAKSFALEVWSKIAGSRCLPGEPGPDVTKGFGNMPFGTGGFGAGVTYPDWSGRPQYGYSLFPWLKGGTLSGFVFSNGLVSFNLRNAKAQKGNHWGSGPYPSTVYGGVSRNAMWRNILTIDAPPAQTDGIITDSIDGGTASFTSADTLDGEFVATSSDRVEGGSAA